MVQVLRQGVFRSVDNAQLSRAPALNGGLHQAALTDGDECHRLYDLALSALACQFLSPECGLNFILGIQACNPVLRSLEQGWIGFVQA